VLAILQLKLLASRLQSKAAGKMHELKNDKTVVWMLNYHDHSITEVICYSVITICLITSHLSAFGRSMEAQKLINYTGFSFSRTFQLLIGIRIACQKYSSDGMIVTSDLATFVATIRPLIPAIFTRAMHVVLARYCYRMSSVRPSVCLSVRL